MAVPGEECRSTRGFQMKVRGILPITFVIFFLIGVLLYFFFLFAVSRHLVLRTESTEESTIGGGWEMPPPEPAVDRAQSSLEG